MTDLLKRSLWLPERKRGQGWGRDRKIRGSSTIIRARMRKAGPQAGSGSGGERWGGSGFSGKVKPTEHASGHPLGSLYSNNSSGKRWYFRKYLSIANCLSIGNKETIPLISTEKGTN